MMKSFGASVIRAGVVVWMLAPGAARWARPNVQDDQDAVREVVELYFKGIDENDEEALNRAFHPEAQLEAALGGYWERPFHQWVRFVDRPVAADAAQRRNTIVSIDIEGDAAVAKTELVWPSIRYVDYLSLLRIDGRWRIVNKIWHQEPRAQQ